MLGNARLYKASGSGELCKIPSTRVTGGLGPRV